jgi:hypothetical protein
VTDHLPTVKPNNPTASSLRRDDQLSKVRPRGPGDYWVDHATLKARDVEVLADARYLTLWNVKVPPGFFEALGALEFLDLRGGSAPNLAPIANLTALRGLVVNQVRGLTALDELSGLIGLEILSLYGLAHVSRLPSLASLVRLRRVEIGQMRTLADLRGLAEAPYLEEVQLQRKLPIDAETVRPLRDHPTLRAFGWFWEDVAASQALPVLEVMKAKATARSIRPEHWLAEQNERPS